MMGSGGMIVADETTCMVEFAKYFMQFVCDESCGKCPPCRIGSTRMLEMLERITEGQGKPEDLEEIRRLAKGMQAGSLCALGQTGPDPVLVDAAHFRGRIPGAHRGGTLPGGAAARRLITYEIIAELCTGCMVVRAQLSGQRHQWREKEPHMIDPNAMRTMWPVLMRSASSMPSSVE